jgi:hypothetical protein
LTLVEAQTTAMKGASLTTMPHFSAGVTKVLVPLA